jgi:hypothetical protein
MAAKKASKGAARKRQGGKTAMKDLAPTARRAKAVKGGLLPAVQAHNYQPVSSIMQKVVDPSFKQTKQ